MSLYKVLDFGLLHLEDLLPVVVIDLLGDVEGEELLDQMVLG